MLQTLKPAHEHRSRLLLLAAMLVFVLGQWLALAHTTQHELKADASVAKYCQLCDLAQSGKGTAGALPQPPQITAGHERCVAELLLAAPTLPQRRPRCRAPPSNLV